jgi:hypothetical protein
MSQTIIGFSGRAQSGKSTCANFMLGLTLNGLGISKSFKVDKDGLFLSDVNGEPDTSGRFDYFRPSEDLVIFKRKELDEFIRLYSFADLLKKNVCMEILGLSWENCYGTNEQKNEQTKYKWEELPTKTKKKGLMTAREVMQYIGTELLRKMYPTVWADSTITKIKNEGSAIAVISDVRFPDEVAAGKAAGGNVFRLTRFQDVEAEHDSETALDPDKYDYTNFDVVLDNKEMDIDEQCKKLHEILSEMNFE